MTTPQKYLILVIAPLLVVGCKDSKVASISSVSAGVPSACPIRSITNGMTLDEVKSTLKPWHLQYRGERQDQLAYHVDAGTEKCRAFIHLSSETHRVTDVEYGEGNFTPPYARSPRAVVASKRAATWSVKDPAIPDFRNGEVVTRSDYILAFVSQNEGRNNLSDDQLMVLGSESWDAIQTAGTSTEPSIRFFNDWRRLSSAAKDQATPKPEGYYPDITKRIYSLSDFGIERPILIHSVRAAYTPAARESGIIGKSTVEMVINNKGVPEQVATAIPIGYGLDESAIAAVKQFRFKPATHFGVPVAVAATYSVDFSSN